MAARATSVRLRSLSCLKNSRRLKYASSVSTERKNYHLRIPLMYDFPNSPLSCSLGCPRDAKHARSCIFGMKNQKCKFNHYWRQIGFSSKIRPRSHGRHNACSSMKISAWEGKKRVGSSGMLQNISRYLVNSGFQGAKVEGPECRTTGTSPGDYIYSPKQLTNLPCAYKTKTYSIC